MLRTLNNFVCTLLIQLNMPLGYWVEDLHTTAYLLNILPSTAINSEIPYTRLFKRPPQYSPSRLWITVLPESATYITS